MAIKLDERDTRMIQDKCPNPNQMNFLHADLLDQLNPKHPLLKLARAESLHLSRTHEKEVKHLKQLTRFANHPRNRKKARRAVKRLKTIAGRLMNEAQQEKHQKTFNFYQRVLKQKRSDKNKIYSLHEPHIYYMNKGVKITKNTNSTPKALSPKLETPTSLLVPWLLKRTVTMDTHCQRRLPK